jgi:DMSO/TMAO reductase YedYZ molybdopterin-dependent catalytic subunit
MPEVETLPLPPGQQLVAPGKWPIIGEKSPANSAAPWSLSISGCVEKRGSFSEAQLRAKPQSKLTIDIHCVTRWSKLGVEFGGVFLADLLAEVNVLPEARFVSFGSRSERGHSSSLSLETALSLNTIIALTVAGEHLGIDHGGPIRNIVPGRYFYKSVKWLDRIELLEHDRLGFWEAESGYHNEADPWHEQRYMSPTIDRRLAARLIATRDFSHQDLRSIDATERDLMNLNATEALLRDARFDRADLRNSDFTKANLSNAHFRGANLQGANFQGADLEGADFTAADLSGANLTDCSLIGASFFSEENGQLRHAKIDQSTIVPSAVLSPLVPSQLDFVSRQLQSHRRS